MRSHRPSFRKWMVWICLGALFSVLYLHFGLFPGRLKDRAIEKIEQWTPFRVDFSKIVYVPLRGVTLYSLRVREKSGEPVFSAGRLRVQIDLWTFLREKKIIVSDFFLDSPVYELILEPERRQPAPPPPKTRISGQIEVPVVPENRPVSLSDLDEGPDALFPENVYLSRVRIRNGTVTLRAKSGGPVLEVLRSVRLGVSFKKPPELAFEGSLELGDSPYAQIALRGSWDLETAFYRFRFKSKSRLIPGWLLDFQKRNLLQFREGKFGMEAQIEGVENERIIFQTKTALRDAALYLHDTQFRGAMGLEIAGAWDPEGRSFQAYRGTLRFESVDVHDLSEKIRRLEEVSGRVFFEPDRMNIESIEGRYGKVPFQASGQIRSFKEWRLEGKIRTESGIREIISLFPAEQRTLFERVRVEGLCQSITVVEGSLRKPSELRMDHKLILREGSVRSPGMKWQLEDVEAEVDADHAGFKIENGRFRIADTVYALSAFIPQEEAKLGQVDLASENLQVSATYEVGNSKVHLKKVAADYRGISAFFQGSVKDFEKTSVDLQGELNVPLGKAVPEIEKYYPGIRQAGLKGVLKGYFTLKGYLEDPLRWEVNIDGRGAPLFVKETVRLDDLEVQVRLKNRVLRIPYIHGAPYGGTVGGELLFDLNDPDIYFDAKVYVNGLDLAPLTRDLEPHDKTLEGIAVGRLSLNGHLNSADSYRGEGAIDIRDGHLGETDLFKKMGNPVAFLKIEGLDRVVFHSLNAEFYVRDRKIISDNFHIFGNTVDLSLRGAAGFDQSLDFLMKIRYSNDVLRGAYDTGGIVPFVVEEAEDFISQYKVLGTLEKPEYEKIPLPVSDVLSKKIAGWFQGSRR